MDDENFFQALLRQGEGHIRGLVAGLSGPEPDQKPTQKKTECNFADAERYRGCHHSSVERKPLTA
eukprot:1398244-Rhodomonas_salina.1